MNDPGWLLVGMLIGVVVTVLIVEWFTAHERHAARMRTRRDDPGRTP